MPRPERKFHPIPFEYHEEIELTIDSLSNLGHGIGRIDGWVVFVSFALPGERVRARVFRNAPGHSEADLVEVLAPSPARVEPRCPIFGECGGCQYQHLEYSSQLDWKRQQVRDLLARLAGIESEVAPVVPSPARYHYRSKITPHFQPPRDGKITEIGFLRNGRRQQLIDVPQCPIASESINLRLASLRKAARDNARSYRNGATLLLRDSAAGDVCIDSNDVCEEQVGSLRFRFHAGEFFQNNPHILEAFSSHVAREAAAGGLRYLVDAYCGSGLFALTAAGRFERVAGIEISEAAIDWSRRNAELNGIANCEFLSGEAHAIFDSVRDRFDPARTAVIIDPPRKGSTPEFLDQLSAFEPRRIVYVSCNPATQMRDLKQLGEAYHPTCVQPFDLFPQTRHLECVVTLERNRGRE